MKDREKRVNYSVLYIFLILFFGWILTQFIAINEDSLLVKDNQITSLAPVNVEGGVRNALSLLEQIFNPILGGIGNDTNGVFLRIIYGLILFWIISIPLRNVLPDDEKSRISRSSAVALIVSLMSAALMPVEWVFLIAESAITFIAIALIFGSLYFIYSFKRSEENRFVYFFKSVLSFVLFNLVAFLSTYSRSKVTTSGVVDVVISFGLITSLIFFIWYLLVKTISGGTSVEEPEEGSAPTESLRRVGDAYAGVGKPVGKGIGWLGKKSWKGSKWAGGKIGEGGKWVFGKAKRKLSPEAAEALGDYQESLVKNLIRNIDYATRSGVKFIERPDEDKFYQFISNVNIVLDGRNNFPGINFKRIMKATRILDNYYRNAPRQDMNIFYKRCVNLARVVLEELVSISKLLR